MPNNINKNKKEISRLKSELAEKEAELNTQINIDNEIDVLPNWPVLNT